MLWKWQLWFKFLLWNTVTQVFPDVEGHTEGHMLYANPHHQTASRCPQGSPRWPYHHQTSSIHLFKESEISIPARTSKRCRAGISNPKKKHLNKLIKVLRNIRNCLAATCSSMQDIFPPKAGVDNPYSTEMTSEAINLVKKKKKNSLSWRFILQTCLDIECFCTTSISVPTGTDLADIMLYKTCKLNSPVLTLQWLIQTLQLFLIH